MCFNPRTRTGCDWQVSPVHTGCLRFNPRTRTGCDKHLFLRRDDCSCFNPRTRTGCDLTLTLSCVSISVSTHAPARGATVKLSRSITSLMFQPTHPHGVRHGNVQVPSEEQLGFNPRTRTGCDELFGQAEGYDLGFNPRTRTGCDVESFQMEVPGNVSTHAPARGATHHPRMRAIG